MKKALLLGVAGYVGYRMVRKSLANKESTLSTCVKKTADYLNKLTEGVSVGSAVTAATESMSKMSDGVSKMMHMGDKSGSSQEDESDNKSALNKNASDKNARSDDKSSNKGTSATSNVAAHH